MEQQQSPSPSPVPAYTRTGGNGLQQQIPILGFFCGVIRAGKKQAIVAAALLVILGGLGGPVQAQGFNIVDQFRNTFSLVQGGIDDLLDKESLKGTRVRVGFAIGGTPDYPGSNSFNFRSLPMITIEYKDKWVFDNGHFTYTLWRDGHFSAGGLASLNFGRKERQNPTLEGLGDIGDTLDFGGFVKYNSPETGTLVDLRLRQGVGEGQGFRADLTLGQAFYKKDALVMLAGARLKYFGSATMRTNFGISDFQSRSSVAGLDAFDTNAGVSEAMAALVAVVSPEKSRWRVIGIVSLGRLMGSAADSPLTQGSSYGKNHGSQNQLLFGTALSYAF